MTIVTMYIIAAISFGIMFHIRFTHEALTMLNTILQEYDFNAPIKRFDPIIYSISTFMFTVLTLPWGIYTLFTESRATVTKHMTMDILKSYYAVEK